MGQQQQQQQRNASPRFRPFTLDNASGKRTLSSSATPRLRSARLPSEAAQSPRFMLLRSRHRSSLLLHPCLERRGCTTASVHRSRTLSTYLWASRCFNVRAAAARCSPHTLLTLSLPFFTRRLHSPSSLAVKAPAASPAGLACFHVILLAAPGTRSSPSCTHSGCTTSLRGAARLHNFLVIMPAEPFRAAHWERGTGNGGRWVDREP